VDRGRAGEELVRINACWMPRMQKTASVLDLAGVTKRFAAPGGGSTLTAIERVSFSVRNGEFVAVVGPSGCGKSTILNLVAGPRRAERGRILLNQVPVEAQSERRLHAAEGSAAALAHHRAQR
jgi:ABC-type nitrate/sulfonate/bicarbonate transport system ATPase subunit